MSGRTGYRLLVSDIDGTLVGKDRLITPETRATIRRLLDQGHYVALATGRPAFSAVRFADDLGLRGPSIIHNGAQLVWYPEKTILWEAALSWDVALPILHLMGEVGISPVMFWQEEVYVQRIDADSGYYLDHDSVTAHETGDIVGFAQQEAARSPGSGDGAATRGAIGPTKILGVGDIPRFEAFMARARQEAPWLHEVTIVQTTPRFLEVMQKGVSKGAALRRLAEILGVPIESTVALGDGPNDVEMLATAGLGIAVGGAHPSAQAAADLAVPYGPGEAVRVAIEEFFLRSSRTPSA